MKTKQLHIRISEQWHKELKEIAKKENTTVTELVRQALKKIK
jgi:predicted HicB family RNase H-like nuclease